MANIYRKALDAAGYHHVPATAENVKECFKDYVDAGYWRDVDLDDVDEITLEEMCRALLKSNKRT